VPGTYTVRLTVDGRTLSQPLRLKMDPRVKTSAEDLRAQLARSLEVVREMARTRDGMERVKGDPARTSALAGLRTRLLALYDVLQEADAAPTAAALETAETLRAQVTKALAP
jgi:hypothetical protein